MSIVKKYLDENGYSSVAHWAIDSGYEYRQEIGYWIDEYGNVVDVDEYIFHVIEENGLVA